MDSPRDEGSAAFDVVQRRVAAALTRLGKLRVESLRAVHQAEEPPGLSTCTTDTVRAGRALELADRLVQGWAISLAQHAPVLAEPALRDAESWIEKTDRPFRRTSQERTGGSV